MTLIGCITFFDDEIFLLDGAIRSLKKYCDKIVAVDGRYDAFPGDKTLSSPECRDFVRSKVDVMIDIAEPLPQWEKRNKYLIGKRGDFYLVLDADETIEGKLPTLTTLTKSEYLVPIRDEDWHIPNHVTRFFKHEKNKKYWKVHHCLWRDGELIHPSTMSILPGMLIIHHRMKRNPERRKEGGIWKRNQIEDEREIRELKHL